VVLEVAHEMSCELGDLDVQRVRELLSHAAVGVSRRTLCVQRILFDDKYRAIEIWIVRQEPRHRGANNRAANDDNVVGTAARFAHDRKPAHPARFSCVRLPVVARCFTALLSRIPGRCRSLRPRGHGRPDRRIRHRREVP